MQAANVHQQALVIHGDHPLHELWQQLLWKPPRHRAEPGGTCAGQDVAVKVLPLQTNTAEDIKREIQLMRHCSCVNIVEYRDAIEPYSYPYPYP